MDAQPIITRAEAIKLGRLKYFTGEACRNGHLSERWVLNYMCCECLNQSKKKDKERIKEIRAQIVA